MMFGTFLFEGVGIVGALVVHIIDGSNIDIVCSFSFINVFLSLCQDVLVLHEVRQLCC